VWGAADAGGVGRGGRRAGSRHGLFTSFGGYAGGGVGLAVVGQRLAKGAGDISKAVEEGQK